MRRPLLVLAFLLLAMPAMVAAEPARTGPEFQANVVTQSFQHNPDVAVGPDGTSLVVWRTDTLWPDLSDVRGRFFDASGAALTGEIALTSTPDGVQAQPRTAVDGQGNFLVIWMEGRELFARSFRGDGTPWSPEVLLSAAASGDGPPSVAGDPRGGFVVVWAASGLAIRSVRLSGQGAVLGQEADFRTAGPILSAPEVATGPDGGFAVTWSEATSTSSVVFVRLFGADSRPRTGALQVSDGLASPSDFQGEAVPVFHPDGSFSVVWLSETGLGFGRLAARRFDSLVRPGAVLGLTLPVELTNDSAPDVTAEPDGTLLVVWPELRATSTDVFGRLFDASWQPLDAPFRINTFTGASQRETAVASAAGRFVAVWGSGEEIPQTVPTGLDGLASQDGSFFGVFGQTLSTRCLTTTALCLAGGRFKVEADWALPETEGRGRPVPMSGDTGAFWFFGPENLELLVKVLDGRAVNGHFWVFFGGLSNVRFTVTVTDTETGEQRSYPHAAGTLASRADTNAFAVTAAASPAAGPRLEPLTRPDRLGGELQANAVTRGAQRRPAVAVAADGSFLIAWESNPGSVVIRAFDSSGTPRMADLPVATSLGDQAKPRVAALPSGQFLVTWLEQGALHGRLFDAAGTPQSDRILIGSDVTEGGSVAATRQGPGGFVATWKDSQGDLRAQRIDRNGRPAGPVIDVASAPVSSTFLLPGEVSASPAGGFAVAWIETNRLHRTVWMRRYDAAGKALGDAVAAGTEGDVVVPVHHPDGRLSLLWSDTWRFKGTFVRTFDPSGSALGPAVRLPSVPSILFGVPAAAADPAGNLLVTWQEEDTALSGSEVYGRFFDATWRPLGGRFRVNSFTNQFQMESAVAAGGPGGFVAVWASGDRDWPDGIFGQRLDAGCLAGEALCLGTGRFRVEVAWKIPGSSGTGHPIPLTGDTGTFWFFGEGNHELMVKVLDGRAVNGRFWVFYGALSDVEYTLTVTDTASGLQRTYRNPAGTLASQADTAAFAAEP